MLRKIIGWFDFFIFNKSPSPENKEDLIQIKAQTCQKLEWHIRNCIKFNLIQNEETKRVIESLINHFNLDLLKLFLQEGNAKLDQKNHIDIKSIISRKRWDILRFIITCIPGSLYTNMSDFDWKEIKNKLSSLPLDIKESIEHENRSRIFFDELRLVAEFNKYSDPDSKATTENLRKLKNDLVNDEELVQNLTNNHLLLAMLTGDVELVKLCLKSSKISMDLYNPYCYCYYDDNLVGELNDSSVLKFLYRNKKTEMLQFLYENYPSIFKYEYAYMAQASSHFSVMCSK